MVRLAVPVLVSVTVWVGLVVFISWVAKVRLVGESETIGPPALPFNRMETVLEALLVTARSSFPSALKSPATTELGLVLVGISVWFWKVPSPFPSRMEKVLAVVL